MQSKFVLPSDSSDFVLKSLNHKWKEYRVKLKRDYKREGRTEEHVAATCPPDVHPHQWMELVHYWFSGRVQVVQHHQTLRNLLIFTCYNYIYTIYNIVLILFCRRILILVELHELLSLFLTQRGPRVMHGSGMSLYVSHPIILLVYFQF